MKTPKYIAVDNTSALGGYAGWELMDTHATPARTIAIAMSEVDAKLAALALNERDEQERLEILKVAPNKEGLAQKIKNVIELGCDALAYQCIAIADTPFAMDEITFAPDGTTTVRKDAIAHRKLQIETRMKLLSRSRKMLE